MFWGRLNNKKAEVRLSLGNTYLAPRFARAGISRLPPASAMLPPRGEEEKSELEGSSIANRTIALALKLDSATWASKK